MFIIIVYTCGTEGILAGSFWLSQTLSLEFRISALDKQLINKCICSQFAVKSKTINFFYIFREEFVVSRF